MKSQSDARRAPIARWYSIGPVVLSRASLESTIVTRDDVQVGVMYEALEPTQLFTLAAVQSLKTTAAAHRR
ncbi:hypothetical protein VCV18_012453 [Metarhizium anisopliae]